MGVIGLRTCLHPSMKFDWKGLLWISSLVSVAGQMSTNGHKVSLRQLVHDILFTNIISLNKARLVYKGIDSTARHLPFLGEVAVLSLSEILGSYLWSWSNSLSKSGWSQYIENDLVGEYQWFDFIQGSIEESVRALNDGVYNLLPVEEKEADPRKMLGLPIED